MDPVEIIVLILAVALVVFTIVYNVVRRRKGSCGCGKNQKTKSGCASCPYCDSCRPKPSQSSKDNGRGSADGIS